MIEQAVEKGIVLEDLSGNRYRVALEGGRELVCYTSGRMKKHHIRVLVGDAVEVVVDPYGGHATNRITRRL